MMTDILQEQYLDIFLPNLSFAHRCNMYPNHSSRSLLRGVLHIFDFLIFMSLSGSLDLSVSRSNSVIYPWFLWMEMVCRTSRIIDVACLARFFQWVISQSHIAEEATFFPQKKWMLPDWQLANRQVVVDIERKSWYLQVKGFGEAVTIDLLSWT